MIENKPASGGRLDIDRERLSLEQENILDLKRDSPSGAGSVGSMFDGRDHRRRHAALR